MLAEGPEALEWMEIVRVSWTPLSDLERSDLERLMIFGRI